MLGPDVWMRALRIENDNRRSVYPRTVYALAFEFNGLLWFYCDTDGTQSLSLHTNRLAEEKNELGELLHAIEPGFVRYRVLRCDPTAAPPRRAPPNACFVESVVALREIVQQDASVTDAALLAYYVEQDGERRGHTVLLLERGERRFAVDPQRGAWQLASPPEEWTDALAWARTIEGPAWSRVAAARWVPAGTSVAPALAQLEQRRLEQEVKMARARIAAGRR